jgi:hypothetical protein
MGIRRAVAVARTHTSATTACIIALQRRFCSDRLLTRKPQAAQSSGFAGTFSQTVNQSADLFCGIGEPGGSIAPHLAIEPIGLGARLGLGEAPTNSSYIAASINDSSYMVLPATFIKIEPL